MQEVSYLRTAKRVEEGEGQEAHAKKAHGSGFRHRRLKIEADGVEDGDFRSAIVGEIGIGTRTGTTVLDPDSHATSGGQSP
jgi:hypothetical protein